MITSAMSHSTTYTVGYYNPFLSHFSIGEAFVFLTQLSSPMEGLPTFPLVYWLK